jgi:hypothetical protein
MVLYIERGSRGYHARGCGGRRKKERKRWHAIIFSHAFRIYGKFQVFERWYL